jgi:hypothetical protein
LFFFLGASAFAASDAISGSADGAAHLIQGMIGSDAQDRERALGQDGFGVVKGIADGQVAENCHSCDCDHAESDYLAHDFCSGKKGLLCLETEETG